MPSKEAEHLEALIPEHESDDSDFELEKHKGENSDHESDTDGGKSASDDSSSSDSDDSGDSDNDNDSPTEDEVLRLKSNMTTQELISLAQRQSQNKAGSAPLFSVKVCGTCLRSNSDHSNEIVECDSCGVSVHEACYGIQEGGSIASNASAASTEPWFCEPCMAGVHQPHCEVCPNIGGIYKETDVGNWVHLVCALYIPQVSFFDPERITRATRKSVPKLIRTQWGIDEIFDKISYRKGASVIRMLHSVLGEEVFTKGIRVYMQTYKYSNACTQDLWDSLRSVSEVDCWINNVGFPIIKVSLQSRIHDEVVMVTQERFSAAHKCNDGLLWHVPVSASIQAATEGDEVPSIITLPTVVLTERSLELPIPAGVKFSVSKGSFVKSVTRKSVPKLIRTQWGIVESHKNDSGEKSVTGKPLLYWPGLKNEKKWTKLKQFKRESQGLQYKSRFLCMETCYNSYEAMSPHHNLARYCIKASCPEQKEENIHQVDCFTACSQHVSIRVSITDWQHWAMALAGHCQKNVEESKALQNHKLTCADKQVWTHITTSQGMSQTDTMESKEEQMDCADKCVEQHRERESEEQMQEERSRKQEERQEQALLSVQSNGSSLEICWRTMIVMTMVFSKSSKEDYRQYVINLNKEYNVEEVYDAIEAGLEAFEKLISCTLLI